MGDSASLYSGERHKLIYLFFLVLVVILGLFLTAFIKHPMIPIFVCFAALGALSMSTRVPEPAQTFLQGAIAVIVVFSMKQAAERKF